MEDCTSCQIAEIVFKVAPNNAHDNYSPTIELIKKLVKQKRLIFYLGDCELNEIDETLYAELHYTVCHYFKCIKCQKIFFIGACIRGTPIFKVFNSLSEKEMKKIIWGKSGILEKN